MANRILDRAMGAIVGALALALIAVLAGVVHAGPIDPPAPPGPTDGVLEPGTPIASLPFTITAPGYYYLTRNLTGSSGEDGIEINVSNVTLDLKGFSLQGVGGSLNGVNVNTTAANVTIRNGTIAYWGGSGVLFSWPTLSLGSEASDLQVSGNGAYGIRMGDRATVHDVTSRENTLDGIATSRDAVIQRCTVSNNQGNGINAPFNAVITDCSVRDNMGDGIIAGQGSVVRGNTVINSGGDGIQIAAGSLVEQNNVTGSGTQVLDGAGVHATGGDDRIVNNLLAFNDRGVWTEVGGSLIIGNYADNADNFGQVAFGGLMGPTLNYTTMGTATNPYANFQPNP